MRNICTQKSLNKPSYAKSRDMAFLFLGNQLGNDGEKEVYDYW